MAHKDLDYRNVCVNLYVKAVEAGRVIVFRKYTCSIDPQHL